MCGIVGWVTTDKEPSAIALVKAMADRISHRGPDDEGFFFAPGVGLGHRRLSIIDLDHGHQPMVTEDNRYVIIYNGEVYNFLAMRKELEKLGEVFVTHSDTEVLLRAFRCWGANSFSKFSGMFAIAIWDSVECTLHLARDHMGIKPLYYIDLGEEFIFASEIKSLFCHPKVKRKMEADVVASFLAFNNTFGEKSFWSGVKRCQPGERLEWREGKLKHFRFFDIGTLQVEPFKGNFEDAAERYVELLSSSVRDHLISDVPVGSYLSAGIDSSSVSLLAAKQQSLPFPVFTGYFKGYESGWYDERSGAKAISRKSRFVHYECPITWNDFHDRLEKVSYHLDEPALGSGAIPQFIVAESVRRQVKVVLTGHGGDELFSGYPVYKASFLRGHGISAQGLRCLLSGRIDEYMRVFYFLLGGIFDPIRARGQFRMFSSSALRTVTGPLIADSLKSNKGIEGLFDNVQPFVSKPDVDGVTRWYIATYLTTLLTQEDKISMAHGLEARVPICCKRLLEFALSLPDSIKLYGGELKAVPRRGLRGMLPSEIFALPKRGFPTPIVDWLSKGDLSRRWEAAWRDPLPEPLQGLLSPKGIVDEFIGFRRYRHRTPQAYAAAHRLVSLQMLHACASALHGIPYLDDNASVDYDIKKIPGVLFLKDAGRLQAAKAGERNGN
jgi:asparagine synthase (glutamine-hydrolysing)